MKYLVQLFDDKTDRRAVVIDWTPEDAKQRVWLHDPKGPWENSECRIVCRVPQTNTSQILALEY